MPYVQANTANHLGWRTLGGDSQFGGGRFLARVTTLGQDQPLSAADINELVAQGYLSESDALAVMAGEISLEEALAINQPGYSTMTEPSPDDAQNVSLVGSQLLKAKEQLMQLDDLMRSSPAAAREIGKDVADAWGTYSTYVSWYQGARALVGLTPDPGLSGLGEIAVGGITVAVAVTLVAVLLVTLGYLWERGNAADATARAAQAANYKADQLDQEAQDAKNSGDLATYKKKSDEAAAYRRKGVPPGGPQDLAQWFMDNAKWIGAIAVVAFVAPAVIKKL